MRTKLVDLNQRLLGQALESLEQMTPERFAHRDENARGSIGEQVRHVLDFYTCFLRDAATGRIDYDNRPRDARAEADPVHACALTRELQDKLGSLQTASPLSVHSDVPGVEDATSSSVERELQFLASHTVHHYALIAILLRHAGLPVPNNFGVAPSTMEYWKESETRDG